MPSKMGMLNPFAKHDAAEFPGVLIPLDQATPKQESTPSAPESMRMSEDSAEKEKKAESPSPRRSADADSTMGTAGFTLEMLRAEVEEDLASGGHDTSYDLKAKVINKAIQDMGMGRYQWQLFGLCGFGWVADNIWLQGVALTLPGLSEEFGVSSTEVRFTTLALFLGLCFGASFWGIISDIIGRRLAFNFTLFLAGAFGLAAAGAPSWIAACALFACVGLGVGGNLPVDGALFLEFLPHSSGNLLTLLSIWWPVGNLIASVIAWGFMPHYSAHWGWRYLTLTMGAITFVFFLCRFFLFHLFESPKFLLSQGKQKEAVAVIHGIAYFNRTTTWLTEDILNSIGGHPDEVVDNKLSTVEIVKRQLSKFSGERIGPLFKGTRLAVSTSLIWFIWTTIGMGYPLFNAFLAQYLSSVGGEEVSTNTTYRNYLIVAVAGVPGSILACVAVNVKYIGRKGTMAAGTVLTGVFVILFTLATNSDFQLGMTCAEAFFQNIMYGTLYAYTPEVFPAPNRGTGSGISSFLNRLAGLCAPLVAIYAAEANPKAPIYASAGLFFAAFVAMLMLPIETRGRQSL